jgi:hypothetical protein
MKRIFLKAFLWAGLIAATGCTIDFDAALSKYCDQTHDRDCPITATNPSSRVVQESAKAGAVAWARNLGTPNGDEVATAIASGPDGTWVTGLFTGSSNFSVPGATEREAQHIDGFLLRLDPFAGTPLSFISFGGPGADQGTGVAVDPLTGNAYLAGIFPRGDFTLKTNPEVKMTGVGELESFIAAFGPDGRYLNKSKQLNAAQGGLVWIRGIATGPGSVVAVGEYIGSLSIDGQTPLPTTTNRAMFVLTFDSDLNFMTAGTTTDCVFSMAESVAIDRNPNGFSTVYVGGRFSPGDPATSSCVFGTDTSAGSSGYQRAGSQPFLAEYVEASRVNESVYPTLQNYDTLDQPSKSAPRPVPWQELDISYKVAANGGMSVLAGPFANVSLVGAQVKTSAGDTFTVRPLTSEVHGAAVDPGRNAWVGGTFTGALEISPTRYGDRLESVLPNKRAAFVAAFVPGSGRWTRAFSSPTGEVLGAELTLDASGAPLFAGSFSGTLNVGAGLDSNGGQPNSPQRDIFVMRFFKPSQP